MNAKRNPWRPRNPAREAARRSGATFFLSSLACAAGHIGERYTSTGACRRCVQLQSQTRSDRRAKQETV